MSRVRVKSSDGVTFASMYRQLAKAGYTWHVFAYFPCNASGVRVAVKKTPKAAERFALRFAEINNVKVSWGIRR